jgi:mono/diheme cytochrome c family protein
VRRAFATLIIVAAALTAQNALAADPAAKADPAAGRRAFDEAKCNGCHDKIMGGDGNRIFTRPDRKITSTPALQKMVRFCIDRTGASLFPEDAEHIAAYLNQQFYKFK